MTDIPCQGCKEDDSVCPTCGGCKVVLSQAVCGNCGREYWVRAGIRRSVFEGKRWISIDGLRLVWNKDKGNVCEATCYEESPCSLSSSSH